MQIWSGTAGSKLRLAGRRFGCHRGSRATRLYPAGRAADRLPRCPVRRGGREGAGVWGGGGKLRGDSGSVGSEYITVRNLTRQKSLLTYL
jgi:hypothetical protein